MKLDNEFELFFNLSSDLMCVAGEDGYFKHLNLAWTRTLGWAEAELLASPLASFIHPDDVDSTFKEVARQLSGESTEAFVNRYRCKDGSYRWLEWMAAPAKSGNLFASARDITDRILAESEMRETEERFRVALMSSSTVAATMDLALRYTWIFNPVSGFSSDAVIGKRDQELLPPEVAAELTKFKQGILDTGVGDQQEFLIDTPDGAIILDINCQPLRNPDGEIVGLTIAAPDVTERKKVEEDRFKNQERIQQAQQLTGLGYYEKKVTGECLYWSDEMYEIFGIDKNTSNIRDIDILELVHPDDRPIVSQVIDLTTAGKNSSRIEFRIVRPDGGIRHVSTLRKPVTDAFGGITKIIGTILDVTELKSSEAQLLQAQKMEAVGQLSTGIAHDFNNLLMAALGNMEIIDDEIDDLNLKEHAASAKRAILRGADLTKRLLAFSRKQKLEPELSDIGNLVSGLRVIFRRTLSENIDIEWHISSDLWPTMIDRHQLENSILNLVLNARDAMRAGGTLTIKCENLTIKDDEINDHFGADAGDYVGITVADTGIGIPETELEKIIEPFYTTKGVGEGSGLGLSMVYGFVRQSEGFIDIKSKPNAGTMVSLYLRRASSVDDVADIHFQQKSDIKPGNGETILVIEDEAEVREITIKHLRKLSYKVIDGGDGKKILEGCDRDRCDFCAELNMVLSDIILPNRTSGPELIQRISRCNPKAKVVLMTGYSKKDISPLTDEELNFQVLGKPFTKDELARKVSDVLTGGGD